MISDVVRPAFEDVFSRKESFTEAFNVTGLYPFNPQAPDRSKLQPGDQYQPSEDSPSDIQDVEVSTAEPQPGPGSAPDIVLNNCSIPEPTQGPSSAQDSVGLYSPSVSEPGGPASHTEDKLRTARVKTREDKKRQLDKFQAVMLESDQQEEFEELYQ